MKVDFLDSFREQLNNQVKYIARDKPQAARQFKNNLLAQVKRIGQSPMTHRKSIFFDDVLYRDMVFNGYKVVFRIDKLQNTVFVIGLVNMQKDVDLH